MRRLVLVAAIIAFPLLPTRADALTVRDVVELTHAGLGDEVLLALIEVDPSVFPIDADTIKRLKSEGVSERVIVAMVRSARTVTPPLTEAAVEAQAVAPAPEPQVVVIDHHDEPAVREVPVAIPVYVPYVVRSRHDTRVIHDTRADRDARAAHADEHVTVVPTLTGLPPSADHTRVKQPEPQYWGFGGKLRPDAWQPTPDPSTKKHDDR